MDINSAGRFWLFIYLKFKNHPVICERKKATYQNMRVVHIYTFLCAKIFFTLLLRVYKKMSRSGEVVFFYMHSIWSSWAAKNWIWSYTRRYTIKSTIIKCNMYSHFYISQYIKWFNAIVHGTRHESIIICHYATEYEDFFFTEIDYIFIWNILWNVETIIVWQRLI